MRRQLNPAEVEFLVELVRRRAGAPSLVDALRRGRLNDDDAEALLDLVTDELAERGFDDRYAANPQGRTLEEIIDALNKD
jgi:hypothetical protein